MAKLTGTMYFTPSRPSGISSVSAASGPYAAELNASSPKTGMPASGPMHSARSAVVGRGRPNSKLRKRVYTPMGTEPAAVDLLWGVPPMPVSHGAPCAIPCEPNDVRRL